MIFNAIIIIISMYDITYYNIVIYLRKRKREREWERAEQWALLQKSHNIILTCAAI